MSGTRHLLRLHVETLFTMNDVGQLERINEPGGGPAPRFFMGVTDEGSGRWFRSDVDAELVLELEALPGFQAPNLEAEPDPVLVERFGSCLARSGAVLKTWTGLAFRFPVDLPDLGPAIRVTPANSEVLEPHFRGWLGGVTRGVPMLAVLASGSAVSLCASARMTSAADQAGVETHPDFRGRGHGAAATSAWAKAVQAMGRTPLYSTSWENLSSRTLARRLGLVQFSADLHLT